MKLYFFQLVGIVLLVTQKISVRTVGETDQMLRAVFFCFVGRHFVHDPGQKGFKSSGLCRDGKVDSIISIIVNMITVCHKIRIPVMSHHETEYPW